ncbi:DNA polymerase III subunits gamma and tau [Formosa sp. Hel3_A1_48]|uniref:DNA polymerase III subunit gamma/tau n=1 Tax=Formosa sp. Hel3_A1_48 TaxID=1336795 RepID=UPI00084E2362|nr:DNA polymerase III subunit gamma/tau [Formosa sp. Hel3_A1_48]AOR27001.1 DNA polymerase III subunits gamma and tau [Formosa sp. Hel3_A1_48]MDC0949845.1 DNA polymerase III subunit gamma/tau [Flavobacteriaceae bacterium]
MENFVVSALKYRPKTFKDVVGQSAITQTLENAIKENHLAQALLFTGPRGVGKTSCARILAKMINSNGSVDENEDYAFNIFELDAASNNSVDDIRNLTDQVRIPPQVGSYKVYIIDEVHMLSSNAFNAFLKTLEEPPKHCIFILATTEKHKIIPTILSRCQIFDFKRITVTDAKNYLKVVAKAQNIEAEDDALHIIAQKADGAMRDALSIFDRVVSFSGKNLTRKAVSENLNVLDYETFFKITDLILDNAIPSLLIQFNQILARGFEGQHFIAGLASHFRDLYVAKSTETLELLEVGADTKERYKLQSERTSPTFLKEAISLANDCDLKYKTSRNQRLLVELCLMKLASINFDGEKKKSEGFIIPASFFKDKNLSESKTESDQNIPQTNSVNSSTELPSVEEPETKYNPPKIEAPVIKGIKRQASGLSLKSIQQKKAHQIKQMDVEIKEEDLPSDSFTQDQLNEYWDTFVDKLEKKGKYNLAAILKIDTPKLTDDDVIQLEFPNSTNKIEVERNQFDLLQFLRKSLNNFNIRLEISVNEALDKKYAYTSEDKYAKLLKKNPALETLKQTFNLDL